MTRKIEIRLSIPQIRSKIRNAPSEEFFIKVVLPICEILSEQILNCLMIILK